jgi:phosphatidylserine decarboxylase
MRPNLQTHQYVERHSGRICDETLFGDRVIRALYDPVREKVPALFNLLTGPASSKTLAYFNYDSLLGARILGNRKFLEDCRVDWDECLDPPEQLDTARKFFERKIRYWETRPLPGDPQAILSPADARVIVGSFNATSGLFLKEKFFAFDELFGTDKLIWQHAFAGGDFAVFRLTPDKYHYNHVPVSGIVVDHYQIDGRHHSCNPDAVVRVATPFSKNQRVVTVINTNVPGGSHIGQVAMIEVVALMIGDIRQAYSRERYDDPRQLEIGMWLERGFPKSLYRPGSSTDVLIFQPGRVRFAVDLLANQQRPDVASRFSLGFGQTLVETEVQVRSLIALPDPQRPGADPAQGEPS